MSKEISLEKTIKATYLYKLSKFVSWSHERVNNKTGICIFGESTFLAAKAIIDEYPKYQKGHVLTHIFAKDMNISKCDIFYIDSEYLDSVPKFKLPQTREHVVTVSDDNHFLSQGGMIELANRGGRIRMLISMREVKKSKIKLSAKLMEVGELQW